ncbi:MAG: hypothetical protein JRF29_12835 [Deltaproteobacteria bacterium]|jgi:F0F1-type ATP synthase assembly protein I|nr:hypothetical protein [Deltaproteobacteria bacterium]
MAKRRQLKDAMAEPVLKAQQPFQRAIDKNESQSLPKIILSVAAVAVGVMAGVLLNRYLKII